MTFGDNVKVTLGDGGDADIYYNAADLIINPKVAGSGKLGIGNTTPTAHSDASGTSVVIGESAATDGLSIISSGNGRIAFGDGNGDPGEWQGIIQYAHANDGFLFYTANTARMAINATGVGIGTATPAGALEVVVTPGVPVRITDPSASANASEPSLGFYGSTDGATRLGYVGIGSTANSEFRVVNSQNDAMWFGTNNTERMRIDANGRLNNEATPVTAGNGALGIYNNQNGQMAVTIANTHGSGDPLILDLDFSGRAADNNTGWFIRCQDSSAARMYVYSDGDVWTSDAGTLTSDERLKNNIVDASDKLADVMKLKVRNFEWNTDYHPAKGGEKKLGFIAQELETVFPSLITEHDVARDNKIDEELYDADDDTQYYVEGDELPEGKKIGEVKTESQIPDGKEIGDIKVAAKAHEPKMRKAYKNAFAPILVKALQEVTTRLEAAETKIAALESA
jgi:hypothetical protein